MLDNLINKDEQPENPQEPDPTFSITPISEPYISVNITPQPQQQKEPVIQPTIQENLAEPSSSPDNQSYLAQPIQQNTPLKIVHIYHKIYIPHSHHRTRIYKKDLEEKKCNLRGTEFAAWIIFILQLINVIVRIILCSEKKNWHVGLGEVKTLVIFFFIAYLVNKSIRSYDVKFYNLALFIFIVYNVLYSISFIYIFMMIKKEYNNYDDVEKIEVFIIVIMSVLELVQFILFCCCKKNFK